MDTAVQLVQAYLHVNGYFTVAEYPVLASSRREGSRTVTDLDILAYRFAGAGHELISHGEHRPMNHLDIDPALGCRVDVPDMIVGEVKEGPARVNPALRDPLVLEVALARFGCCAAEQARSLVRELLNHGHATTEQGHVVRIVAFGNTHAHNAAGPWRTISMGHVVLFLQAYLHLNWDVLRHTQLRDPAFAVLALIEKWNIAPLDVARSTERTP